MLGIGERDMRRKLFLREDEVAAFISNLLAGHGESSWLWSEQLLRNTIDGDTAWMIESEFVDLVLKLTGQFEKVAWAVRVGIGVVGGTTLHLGAEYVFVLQKMWAVHV